MAKNLTAHPLFPPKSEDDEAPEVHMIHIMRKEAQGMTTIPRRFLADDLNEEQQIYDLYGGGSYELVARAANGYVTARRGIILAGSPKPLHSEPAAPAPTPQTAPQAAQSAQQQGGNGWLAVASVLTPIFLQWMTGQQQMQQQNQQQMATLMATIMTQAQQSNAQIITLLTNVGRTGPQGADFKEGMNFMQELLAGQMEAAKARQESGDGGDDIGQTIMQLSKAMEFVQGLGAIAGNGPPPITTPGSPVVTEGGPA